MRPGSIQSTKHVVEKIVSGGQTGVDRGALDIAHAMGIPCGGWCPKSRKAEDGRIPPNYRLQETPSSDYSQRTEWNVRDSDGTLALTFGEPVRGTALTIRQAKKQAKPCKVVDLDEEPDAEEVEEWMRGNGISILNLAGPRGSQGPDVNRRAKEFLNQVLGQRLGSAK